VKQALFLRDGTQHLAVFAKGGPRLRTVGVTVRIVRRDQDISGVAYYMEGAMLRESASVFDVCVCVREELDAAPADVRP
jgi:hypothetical protein